MKNKKIMRLLFVSSAFNLLLTLFSTSSYAFEAEKVPHGQRAMFTLLICIGALVAAMIIFMLVIGILGNKRNSNQAPKPQKAEKPQIEEKNEAFAPENEENTPVEELSEDTADIDLEDGDVYEETVDGLDIPPLDKDMGFKITAKYRKSFTAKLIQSHSPVQKYYNEIKNELLSYGNIKSRVSWNYDSFTDGKKSIAKISINGKTLTIFLALKPSLFPQSKYHHRDVSDISKYAKTPLMMKMRSDRSVKYVKELISVYMQLNDISKNNRKAEDHFLPYETTQALVRKKLIKKL